MSEIKYRGPLRVCVYPTCTKEDRGKLKRLTWHAFPDSCKENERRKMWVEAVRKDVGNPYWIPLPMRGHVVCSRHFPEDAFLPAFKRRTLKKDAVPQAKPPDEKDENQNEHTKVSAEEESKNRINEDDAEVRNASKKKFMQMYESFQPILNLLYNPENADWKDGRMAWERSKAICEICGMLAGSRMFCRKLSEDHVTILLQSLLLFCPERETRSDEGEEEGDDKERKGRELWACKGCIASVGNLVMTLHQMEKLRCKFNNRRKSLGKLVILMSLKKTQEEFDEWMEQVKSVEDVYYPWGCVKRLLSESIDRKLPSDTEEKVGSSKEDVESCVKSVECPGNAVENTPDTVGSAGWAGEGSTRIVNAESSLKTTDNLGTTPQSSTKIVESSSKPKPVESSAQAKPVERTLNTLENSGKTTQSSMKAVNAENSPNTTKSSYTTPQSSAKTTESSAKPKPMEHSETFPISNVRGDSGKTVKCYGKKVVANVIAGEPLQSTDKIPEVSSSSGSSISKPPLPAITTNLASLSDAAKEQTEIPSKNLLCTTNTVKDLTELVNLPGNCDKNKNNCKILIITKDVQGDTPAPSKKRFVVAVRPVNVELPSKRPRTVAAGPSNESAVSNQQAQSLPQLPQQFESRKDNFAGVLNPPLDLELVKVEESESAMEIADPLELTEDPLQLPSDFEAGGAHHPLLEWTLGEGTSNGLKSLPPVHHLKMGSTQQHVDQRKSKMSKESIVRLRRQPSQVIRTETEGNVGRRSQGEAVEESWRRRPSILSRK